MTTPEALRHSKFGIVAVIGVAVMLAAIACAAPKTSTRTGQLSTTTRASARDGVGQSVVEEDVVARLWDTQPDAPVGVAFGHHAAIYLLERNDPNFAAWFAVLQRSLKDGSRVRFSYDVVGPRLTLVEPAQ